jgi:lambda family phage portal protein
MNFLKFFPFHKSQDHPSRSTSQPVPARPEPARPFFSRRIAASYDAAKTDNDNKRHWAMTDALSADEANSLAIRSTLRMRARYEIANNCYAKGVVSSCAKAIVGRGPRLQMLTSNLELNRQIEKAWRTWAKKTQFAKKLRVIEKAKIGDGEGFALLHTNKNLNHEVKLTITPIECDRVTAEYVVIDPNDIDGIMIDSDGEPQTYRVLDYHPGSLAWGTNFFDAHVYGSEYIIHRFREDRAGQHRGIPEITPALPLFAQLRRYTLAVIGAAETAASLSAVVYTDAPANGEASSTVEPMDSIPIERNVMLTLPDGWKMGQMDSKQPVSSYSDFKHEIINEIARCLDVPYNVAAGNSSSYNYASGRLDNQEQESSISIDRQELEDEDLDGKIFPLWLYEYALSHSEIFSLPEYLADGDLPHQWFWDGRPHVDPAKEARAQALRISSRTTNLKIEYAKQGLDWEEEIMQFAKEQKMMRELGLPDEKEKLTPGAVVDTGNESEIEEEGEE